MSADVKKHETRLGPDDEPNILPLPLALFGLWKRMQNIMRLAAIEGHLVDHKSERIPDAELWRRVHATPAEVAELLPELERLGVFHRTEAGVIYSPRMVQRAALRRTHAPHQISRQS